MEAAQANVQEAVTNMVNSLDSGHLRKLQFDMYHCSAKCCENRNANLDDVQRCIDNCSVDVNKAQNYLQNEIEMFQNRLQRCAMSCQDKIRDALPARPDDKDVASGRANLEKCVIECARTHVELVPGLTKKILDTLKSKS